MGGIVQLTIRRARRIVILVVGGTVILIGMALLFLPGPGLLVIFTGLAILASEFIWARRLLKRVREESVNVVKQSKKTMGF